jgi:hypothetical protein
MGTKAFDFLSESFLFDDERIRDRFAGVPEAEILKELRRYREFCLSSKAELEQEALSNSSNLKLFSGVRRVDPVLLKQSAFYVEQHILYDPLFELTSWRPPREDRARSSYASLLGGPGPDPSFDKDKLAETAAYLKGLTPMVAADYVKILPTSYFFEPPERFPLKYSENGFADAVPQSLRQFFHKNAVVESTKRVGDAIIIDGSFELGRGIYVRFEDHGVEDAKGYLYVERQVMTAESSGRTMVVSMHSTPWPLERKKFDDWVYQSINQTAGHLYRRVVLENTFAARFGASYFSDSPFVFRLLEQLVPVEDTVRTNTANALMNMELPFLDGVDVETLMKVRREDGEAFQSFRLELDKQLRDLRLVEDPETLRVKTENAMHELSEVQVHQINQKVSYLKKRIFAEAALTAGGLLGAVQSGGYTLPLALLAAFQGYKSFAEYQRQKRENPAFFLWKVLRGSQRTSPPAPKGQRRPRGRRVYPGRS